MNVLLLYAHPERKSYTHAMLEAAKAVITSEGHSYEVSDLYGEGFNPVAGRHDFTTCADPDYFHYQTEQALAAKEDAYAPDIRREQDRVERADMFVFLFPLWWGGIPAIMKGWLERVLSFGFAYADGMRYETGYFHGRAAIMGITTGGTPARFSDISQGGSYGTIEQVLWPVQHCALHYLGMKVFEPYVAYATPRVDQAAREQMLADWDTTLRGHLRELKDFEFRKAG